MTRVRLLIRIVSIAIVTIFLMVCITAGVFLLMYNCDFAPASISENIFGVCYVCYDFGHDVYAAARYYCWPYPPSDNWIECRKVKHVQRYLRNEKVKRIAFGRVEDEGEASLPDNWGWGIVELERIKQTLHLINSAKKDLNISIVWLGRMIIITDKHKFIIPVEGGDKAIYGLDWTSKELRKKIWEWGGDRKVYKYDFPSKEQVVAILLYPPKLSLPLAFFGDKRLAEKLLFEPQIRDEPNGIKGIADLYKFARLREFGFESNSNKLESKKIFEGRIWLDKIIDAYEVAIEQAKKREKYFPMELDNSVGRIVFMTRDRDYWKEIGISENTVYDDYIKSEQLKTYFDELGLTKELLAGEPNKAHKN